jgi:hypothetical protein
MRSPAAVLFVFLFEKRTGERPYRSPIPAGQKPPAP